MTGCDRIGREDEIAVVWVKGTVLLPLKTTSSSLEPELEMDGDGDGLRSAMAAMAAVLLGEAATGSSLAFSFSPMVPCSRPALINWTLRFRSCFPGSKAFER